MKCHENLEVWNAAVDLATLIYEVTRCFPDDEKFGLTSQMRRASVSVASNIAEGAARIGEKEFLHFLSLAAGSASELNTHLVISEKIGLLCSTRSKPLCIEVTRISRMIQGLIKPVRKRIY